jgi:hypothetical protein
VCERERERERRERWGGGRRPASISTIFSVTLNAPQTASQSGSFCFFFCFGDRALPPQTRESARAHKHKHPPTHTHTHRHHRPWGERVCPHTPLTRTRCLMLYLSRGVFGYPFPATNSSGRALSFSPPISRSLSRSLSRSISHASTNHTLLRCIQRKRRIGVGWLFLLLLLLEQQQRRGRESHLEDNLVGHCVDNFLLRVVLCGHVEELGRASPAARNSPVVRERRARAAPCWPCTRRPVARRTPHSRHLGGTCAWRCLCGHGGALAGVQASEGPCEVIRV